MVESAERVSALGDLSAPPFGITEQ